VHKELYKSAYYKPSTFSSAISNLILLFGFLLLLGGVLFCIFFFDDKKWMWYGLAIAGGVFLFFVVLSLICSCSSKSSWLKRRQKALQHILDEFNPGFLKEKHCFVKAGPFGSYLKFIFTVSSSSCKNLTSLKHNGTVKTLGKNVSLVNPDKAKELHLEQQNDEQIVENRYIPASIKNEKKVKLDNPVYTQVDSGDNGLNYNPGNIVQTDAISNPEDNQTEELPTIKTEINPEKIIPTFEVVKVKSALDDKIANKINLKAGKKKDQLVDLADSNQFQTDVRKQNGDTDSQSDFDDLEFADVSSED
jgi:hypothetical protein